MAHTQNTGVLSNYQRGKRDKPKSHWQIILLVVTSHIRATHTQSLTPWRPQQSRTVRVSAAELILGLAVSVSWGLEYKSAFTIQSGRAGLWPGSLPRRPSVTLTGRKPGLCCRPPPDLVALTSPAYYSNNHLVCWGATRTFLLFQRNSLCAHLHTRRASNTHTHPWG